MRANLGDELMRFDSLPSETNNRIAAAVALEIREMLYDSIVNAETARRNDV